MAAAVHLAKAGIEVVCIEPEEELLHTVGESLDWSAPDLLRALGLPMDQLIRDQIATYKKHVTLNLSDGSSRHYIPSDWLGQPPFNIDLETIHVDRFRLDEALRKIAISSGLTLVHDNVTAIESDGRRVTAVNTAKGARFASPWFVDASGSGANLFPRKFNLPAYEYGPRKVALWNYFTVPEPAEGTTLYADCGDSNYFEWVWEIPIRSDRIGVGYVAPGDSIKRKRQEGLSIEEIFRQKLAQFPRFDRLLKAESSLSPCVTSFHCRVHKGASGPNWVVVGEAASMVDPMTANGVTAALRHAAEGSDLIIRARRRRQLPPVARALYNRRVLDVGKFFNCGIEKVIYEGPIRNRIGPLQAGDLYTAAAWSLNVVYSRLRPKGVAATLLYGFVLGLFRTGAGLYQRYCRQRHPVAGVAAKRFGTAQSKG